MQVFRRLALSTFLAIAFVLINPGQVLATSGVAWPVQGNVSAMYEESCSSLYTHDKGVKIASNLKGLPVYAAQDGLVTASGYSLFYGRYIIISHANGWSTMYGNLADVYRGSGVVTQAELIATTGVKHRGSTEGLLYFEVRKNGIAQNFNKAMSCGQTIYDRTAIRFNFADLYGFPPEYEEVTNGGGTRITGNNAYLDVSSTGQVYAWNTTNFGGSPYSYNGRFVDAKVTPGALGYWLLTSAGQVFTYGNAHHFGDEPQGFSGEIVAMAAQPNSQGYAMVSSLGQVYTYNMTNYGGSPTTNIGKFVDIELTPDGQGYWLLTSAGEIFAYGNAQNFGDQPKYFVKAMVAMSLTPSGNGYVMASKTGEVFAYGDAQVVGTPPTGHSATSEITDISYRQDGYPGYLMITSDGKHYGHNYPFIDDPTGFSGFF
ncbi:MAG: M23 family metallopeptidase [Candidatus Woesebacteria bacterium]|jgi:hypothetical protein